MAKNQEENSEALTKMMSKFIYGYALSKAIYDDYCKSAAQAEGISIIDVQKRIDEETEKYFKEFKDKFKA